jgi:hypothetical protein
LGPVVMFCSLRLVFGGTEGVGSRFNVLRSHTHFWRYGGCRVPFSCCCAHRLIIDGAECVSSCFHVLPARTHFPRYRGRRVPFSCFGGNKGAGSRFPVLRNRSRFPRYRGRHVQFSCFVLPSMYLAVPRDSGPVFMFCTPGLIFCGTEVVWSRFHVLRSKTRFRLC